jgi:hypothetical protein
VLFIGLEFGLDQRGAAEKISVVLDAEVAEL